MSAKIFTRGVLGALFALVFLTAGLSAKGTSAGSLIISTNAWVTYSNTAATPTGYATNTTNAAISNLVLAVFGFSNYSVQYATNTNSVVAGNTYFYPLWLSNNGNTNASVLLSAGSNQTGSFGSPWVMSWVDSNSNALASQTASMAADVEFRYLVKVVVDPAADDGSTMSIIVTNAISDAAAATRTFRYDSPSNGMWYGGTNFETNVINLKVGGPKLIIAKSYSVTNYALANNDVVPGSFITYTISYTNIGSGSAANVVIDDRIDNALVQYSIATAVGGTVDFYNGAWGYAGDTATTASINANVQGLRFALGTIASAGSGTVTYRVVVR